MIKTTIIGRHDNEDVAYCYYIEKAENIRVIHIERLDEDDTPYEEHAILIAKIGCWYYMSCPALGTAAYGIGYIGYAELVADTIQTLGFDSPEIDAFTHIILEIAELGF